MTKIFTSQTPATPDVNNANSITVGTYFSSSADGTITQIHWFLPATLPGGAIKAALFENAGGTKISGTDVTFSSPVAGAWNTVNLSSAVPITNGLTYCAAVRTPDRYAASTGVSSPWPITNGELTAPSLAGRFQDNDGDGSVQFPSDDFNAGCYFVDVTFVAGGGATPVTSSIIGKYRVYGGVSSSLIGKYRVYSAMVSSLVGKWNVFQAMASSSLIGKWNVFQSTGVSSLIGKWRVLQESTSSLVGKWRVYDRVVSSLIGKWHVEQGDIPPPVVSSNYLQWQRRMTEALIADDPTTASLVPVTRAKTDSGGFTEVEGGPREDQTFKMSLLAYDQRPTVTLAGVERVIDYHLIGRWDMAIAVGDYFIDAEETRWDVVGFSEGWDYMTKAFVSRHIPRDARP